MKRFVLFALIIASVATVGCAGLMYAGTGHAQGGSIMANSTYGAVDTTSTTYQFERKDFDVLGQVTAVAQSTSILGWIEAGDAGYATLLKKAKEGKNADDVIDVRIDYKYSNILGLYAKVDSQYQGVAVKWK